MVGSNGRTFFPSLVAGFSAGLLTVTHYVCRALHISLLPSEDSLEEQPEPTCRAPSSVPHSLPTLGHVKRNLRICGGQPHRQDQLSLFLLAIGRPHDAWWDLLRSL